MPIMARARTAGTTLARSIACSGARADGLGHLGFLVGRDIFADGRGMTGNLVELEYL